MKLFWDIYEIESSGDTLHGVMLRGRIRKFAIENNITCLAENSTDKENAVRFALITKTEARPVIDFITKILPDSKVSKIMESVENPVLSKLKVNDSSRYNIK
jgi:hypothetical protein